MDSRDTHQDRPLALRSAAGTVALSVSLAPRPRPRPRAHGTLEWLTRCAVAQLLGNYVDVDLVAKYANSSEIIT
jgi:hypothetical protein|eukprot:COSAG02_NODE_17759_length_983_cov_1.204751_2_plen_74_part_00